MDILDFAEMIGATVEIVGRFSLTDQWVNANLKKDCRNIDVIEDGCLVSKFGRSSIGDVRGAIANLAHNLSGQKIAFNSGEEINVPKLSYLPKGELN